MERTPYQLSLFTAAAGSVGFFLWRLWEWYRARSFGLKDIRGPDTEPLSSGSFSSSGHSSAQVLIRKFLLFFSFTFPSTGNVDKARQSEAGELDFLWREQFGGIMRLKGPFGVRSFQR